MCVTLHDARSFDAKLHPPFQLRRILWPILLDTLCDQSKSSLAYNSNDWLTSGVGEADLAAPSGFLHDGVDAI
jgi:hypothetical protein